MPYCPPSSAPKHDVLAARLNGGLCRKSSGCCKLQVAIIDTGGRRGEIPIPTAVGLKMSLTIVVLDIVYFSLIKLVTHDVYDKSKLKRDS